MCAHKHAHAEYQTIKRCCWSSHWCFIKIILLTSTRTFALPWSQRPKLTGLIPVQISFKWNSLLVHSHSAYVSPLSDLLTKTSTGMRWGFSHLPQPLSITSLSLTRSLSTESKLDVLQGCLCNVFMTSCVLMLLLLMLTRATKRWKAGTCRSIGERCSRPDLLRGQWGRVRLRERQGQWGERSAAQRSEKRKYTETVTRRRCTQNNKPQHKNNNRVVAKLALKYTTLWSYDTTETILFMARI